MAKDNSTYLALSDAFAKPRKSPSIKNLGTQWKKSKKITKYKEETTQGQHKDNIGTELGTTWGQHRDNIGTESGTSLRTRKGQLRDNLGTDNAISKKSISHISGSQLVILKYLFNICRANASFSTGSVSIDHLSKELSLKKETAKKSIQRLINKGYLQRSDFFRGRSGWTIYLMNESIFRELSLCLRDNIRTTWGQHKDNIGTESGTESGTNFPCSSSFNYNNEITTTTELPPDWQSIDFCKLNEKIYFGMNDLKNIYKAGKLTSAEFQQSIHGFAYRLENDEKFRREIKNKKSYFMSTSLDGGSFHDPEKVQILKKQKEAEEMMAHYQEQDRLRAIQDRQREENFKDWCNGLNPQKKDEILAKLSPDKNTFIHHKAALYKYYEDNELES